MLMMGWGDVEVGRGDLVVVSLGPSKRLRCRNPRVPAAALL